MTAQAVITGRSNDGQETNHRKLQWLRRQDYKEQLEKQAVIEQSDKEREEKKQITPKLEAESQVLPKQIDDDNETNTVKQGKLLPSFSF